MKNIKQQKKNVINLKFPPAQEHKKFQIQNDYPLTFH